MSRFHPARGFLPPTDPLRRLPAGYRVWGDLVDDLPGLLAAGRARRALERMPLLDARDLASQDERELALGVLSVFGHAAVHESWRRGSASTVPASVAVPWASVAKSMGRFPVLTYASHGLNNWRRIDPDGPIALGNLVILRNFFGGLDENWFVATHVEIEALAGPLAKAVARAQDAVESDSGDELEAALRVIADALDAIFATLVRVRENCDPHVFFNRVQPFMQGMKNVVYEGVDEFNGQPQNHPGGSGAQSALMPLLDAALGIQHAGDALITYLQELRRYIPREHDAFLSQVESGPSIRAYVARNREPGLLQQYNRCIEGLGNFRAEHLSISIEYIQKPAQQQANIRGERGTGGSPFVGYLEKHRKETFSNYLQ